MALILSKEARILLEEIRKNGGEGRFVGGCVRDFLLKNKQKGDFMLEEEGVDIDIAVNMPVEEVARVFSPKYKVITKYATNIIVIYKRVFEVTSLRRDVNCDGRYAEMLFTRSFEEDSARRDFTINALYMDAVGKVYDYHGGMDDLKRGLVRFIGNPEFRIREDYLRIWRFFRFSCLYGEALEPEGLKACLAQKDGLKLISKERVTAEMLKMMKGSPEKITKITRIMRDGGIVGFEPKSIVGIGFSDPFLRLAALCNGAEVGDFLYTSAQKKFLALFNKVRGSIGNMEDLCLLFYKTEKAVFQDVLNLANFLGEAPKMPENIPEFELKNQDLIKEGFKGAEISAEYERRLKIFIKNFLTNKNG